MLKYNDLKTAQYRILHLEHFLSCVYKYLRSGKTIQPMSVIMQDAGCLLGNKEALSVEEQVHKEYQSKRSPQGSEFEHEHVYVCNLIKDGKGWKIASCYCEICGKPKSKDEILR